MNLDDVKVGVVIKDREGDAEGGSGPAPRCAWRWGLDILDGLVNGELLEVILGQGEGGERSHRKV